MSMSAVRVRSSALFFSEICRKNMKCNRYSTPLPSCLTVTFIEEEAERGYDGRFGTGLPRASDGQLLFLQSMISKMKGPKDDGSRIAIALNGSPLFTGGGKWRERDTALDTGEPRPCLWQNRRRFSSAGWFLI
jgi:hypothetical protein